MGQMKPNTLTGDPYVNQILDFCHGHTGGQGDYHFHAAPECLIQHPDGSEEHYNIVGFALDGYPLIAHYKSVLDASGNPVLDADGETQFDWLETSGYEPNPAYKTQVLEGGATSTYVLTRTTTVNKEISQREFVRSSTAGIFVEGKVCQPLLGELTCTRKILELLPSGHRLRKVHVEEIVRGHRNGQNRQRGTAPYKVGCRDDRAGLFFSNECGSAEDRRVDEFDGGVIQQA